MFISDDSNRTTRLPAERRTGAPRASHQRDSVTARVFTDFAAVRPVWEELSLHADISVYQSWAFASAWHEAHDEGAPLIVIAEEGGRPLLLLPLVRKGAVAHFPGGAHANLCMPLVHRGASHELRSVLMTEALAAAAARGVHLLVLHNVVEGAIGLDVHPPTGWRFTVERFFETELIGDFDVFLRQRRSRRAPGRLRHRLNRLRAAGDVTFEHIDDAVRGAEIIDTLISQKQARFGPRGIDTGLGDPRFRRFCRLLLERGVLAFDVLRVDGRILAIYGGAVFRDRYSACVSSIEEGSPLVRHGPGEVLLAHLVERSCAQGLRVFDLGVGTHEYKRTWCDRALPVRTLLVPLTLRGRAMALPRALWLMLRPHVKRLVVRHPPLRRLAQRLSRRPAGGGAHVGRR